MGTGNGFYDQIKTEVTTRTITGQNTHEEDGRIQHGLTSIASFVLVSSQVVDIGAYDSVQDRWTWMRWETPKVKITRIVSAYAPVYSQAVN